MRHVADATLERCFAGVREADLHRLRGRIANLIGLVIEATGLKAEVGELCAIQAGRNRTLVHAEVVGFRDGRTLLMPLGEIHGIGPGNPITATGKPFRVPIGDGVLGRVLDGLGRPIDGGAPVASTTQRPTVGLPPTPLRRARIDTRLSLGVRALDTLVPCGRGQRLGIFAGSGVGKSSLLGMIARSTAADVNVICLVGERGREVREFVERDLGDGLEEAPVEHVDADHGEVGRRGGRAVGRAALPVGGRRVRPRPPLPGQQRLLCERQARGVS